MKIIEYKRKNSEKFEKYVDIGAIERNQYVLPLFDDTAIPYLVWYNEFIKKTLGERIIIINYYIVEIENEENTIIEKIKLNIDAFINFNDKWFEKETSLFKGLDLNWEDIDDEIDSEIELNENKLEILLHSGDIIRIDKKEEEIKSLYILETEYENFKIEVSDITELLR
jgi:hypothetical protein